MEVLIGKSSIFQHAMLDYGRVQVCCECPSCSQGPRCSCEHTFQPWAAITSQRLKCNSMVSAIPFSHILQAERLSTVPRASHPSSWRQESWLRPSPGDTCKKVTCEGVHQIPVIPESVGQFCTLGNHGKPESDCSTLPGTWEDE